ncbi:MAG TPA: hypothetical protein VGX37_11765 [Allosphingosinicella sp.]|nr:hypothetical protein [Allosphingosinicella sp.]
MATAPDMTRAAAGISFDRWLELTRQWDPRFGRSDEDAGTSEARIPRRAAGPAPWPRIRQSGAGWKLA